jgi:hypothetical protein
VKCERAVAGVMAVDDCQCVGGSEQVITEFSPKVGWAGRDNSIICAAGHHLMDARWLRDGANSTCAGEVADSYSAWYASGLRGVKYDLSAFTETAWHLWARF